MIRTSPNIGTQTRTAALVNALQVTPAAATLLSILATNTGAAQFIQIWDATSSADAGALMLFSFPVSASLPFSLDTPVQCTRGILIRNASQLISANPTANAGAADCLFLTRHL